MVRLVPGSIFACLGARVGWALRKQSPAGLPSRSPSRGRRPAHHQRCASLAHPPPLTCPPATHHLQMLSHIDLSPSDMLLAFSLAMALQRIQRKRLRDEQQQQRSSLPGAAEGEEDGEEAPPAAALGSAGGPATAALGTEAAVSGSGSPPAQQQQQRPQQHSSIQLSEQSSPSPDRAASFCSLDDLLQRNGHDLETGLLGRRRGIGGVGSSSKGAGDLGTDRLESFVPRRPVADSVQLGADKRTGGPHWQLQAGDSKAGERGTVDAGEPCCWVHCHAGPVCERSTLCRGWWPVLRQPGQEDMEFTFFGRAVPPRHAGTIQEAAWAMKFAFASYGMLLYLFAHGPA